jgi:hypothetical protein
VPVQLLSPIPESVLNALPVLDTKQLGRVVHKHTEMDGLPDLDGIKVVIIGV